MGNLFFISLITLLFLFTGGGPAYPETPPPDTQQSAPAEGSAPEPEVAKQVSVITIEDSRLSVELVNANFGETIHSIAKKAGFTVEGSSDVFSEKLTTKFNNLDIDSGFIRLFSLVKESNYLISYDTQGAISSVEIYGSSASATVKTPATRTSTPSRPVRRPSAPTISRPAASRISRPGVRPLPSEPSAPSAAAPAEQMPGEEETIHDEAPPEEVKEIPYIPPQRKPVYIPSMRPGRPGTE